MPHRSSLGFLFWTLAALAFYAWAFWKAYLLVHTVRGVFGY